jgi:hypothetical protein
MTYTNPETGAEIETESDGDFTVTFSMSLPTPPANDTEDN